MFPLSGEYLFAGMVAASLLGAAFSVILKDHKRCEYVAFGLAAVAALAGVACGGSVLLGDSFSFDLPWQTPFGAFSISMDKLSALFVVVISVAALAVSIYSIGYVQEYRGKYNIGRLGCLYNLFILSMVIVATAGNAMLFLIAWEVMSVLSYLLVVYEHRNKEAASAGFMYVVMTHIGTAFIIVGMLLLAVQTGSFDFASFAGAGAGMSSLMKSVVFLLFLIGFGTKAGIVPLHVWLPYAHPAAPGNVSALMSGVMVKLAVLMLIRCVFQFLGVAETWWGLLVLLIASISAVIGVLFALNEKDLKRLLAYSTVENVGIIMIALGASMVFASYGLRELSALALIAALLHVLNHSLFKALLFMGAGAVFSAAHTRNIEQLGGLVKKMPLTAVLFFIGALSIAAIPPLNGFVSEWLIFQSLLLSFNLPEMTVKILIPITIGMLALTGALAAACFVRAYGIAFLAKPRSEHAEHAREVSPVMLAGMGMLALLCILTGIFSPFLIPIIDDASAVVSGVSVASQMDYGLIIKPVEGTFSSVSPIVIAVLLVFLLPFIYDATRLFGGERKTVVADTWDCGTPLTSRNEYTGTAYSKSIITIFGTIFKPSRELNARPTASPYVSKEMTYSDRVVPMFEKYLYAPVAIAAVRLAERFGFVQKGSIQAYLAYIFITLVALLIIFR